MYISSTDRNSYKCIESNVILKKKMESIISIKDVAPMGLEHDLEKYFDLDSLARDAMNMKPMQELQHITEMILKNPAKSESRNSLPFLIALSSEAKNITIKHHLYKVFRQLLFGNLHFEHYTFLGLRVTPTQAFNTLEGEIKEYLAVIQGTRGGRTCDAFHRNLLCGICFH